MECISPCRWHRAKRLGVGWGSSVLAVATVPTTAPAPAGVIASLHPPPQLSALDAAYPLLQVKAHALPPRRPAIISLWTQQDLVHCAFKSLAPTRRSCGGATTALSSRKCSCRNGSRDQLKLCAFHFQVPSRSFPSLPLPTSFVATTKRHRPRHQHRPHSFLPSCTLTGATRRHYPPRALVRISCRRYLDKSCSCHESRRLPAKRVRLTT